MVPGRFLPTLVTDKTHGHAPRRTADTRTEIQVKRRRFPRQGCGYGLENMCTSQWWLPIFPSESHWHTPQRTVNNISALRCGSSSTTAGEAPATIDKTRAQGSLGLHPLPLRRIGTHHYAQEYSSAPHPWGRTSTHRNAQEHSSAPHQWARTGTHHHAGEKKSCRYTALRP